MELLSTEHRDGVPGAAPWLRLGIVWLTGAYATACGVVTLAGWFFQLPRLTDWAGDDISMFPNTAVCAMLCGIALLLLSVQHPGRLRRIVAASLSGFVCALAVATLFQHISAIDLGIDSFLVSRTWGQGAAASPMRMGPPASISFTLLGLSIVLLANRWEAGRRLASGLGLLCGGIACLSLIGYLYGADRLYSLPRVTAIAMQTATTVLAVAMGVIALVPGWGLGGLMSRRDAGGLLARRFVPALAVIALALGWIRLYGQQIGLYDTAFGTAVRTLLEIVLFGLLVWWTANGLSSAERELRKSRAELRAALEEAMKAGRLKDEFLATLSHELRNPMTAILGWSEMLRAEVDPKANVGLAHGLTVIERSARMQSRMIEDLLDVSRIVAGKARLNLQNTDLREVIRSAIDVVRPGAEAKGIAIQTFFNPGVAQIRADPGRIQQALFNLFANAVKFTPSGGEVRIHCTRLNSHVEIAVSDTGVGIAPQFLPHVFDMFRQQDAATTRRFGGLGLGLAIVKRLAEMHGGEVRAASDGEGKGSRFAILLPLAPAKPAGKTFERDGSTEVDEIPVDDGPGVAGLGILVVDDDPDVCELLTRILSARGAMVTVASSVQEALAKISMRAPDVLVSDVGMPDEDGYSLMKKVRQLAPAAGGFVPAVALTAFARAEDRDRAIAAGFDAHLPKPITVGSLVAAIEIARQKM